MTASEARRAGRELALDLVFRPLSNALVPVLARLGVPPPAVVLINAAVGLVAALALARGQLLGAAVLLQLKTLLDNADGQLARTTGGVTLIGRYLDTEADLVVNAAIFAALGYVTGEPLLAAGAFVALTLVLSVDFNVSELHRDATGPAQPPPAATGGRVERLLESTYALVFARLDRGVRRLVGHGDVDSFTRTALANMGLTTQLAVLGLCLAADAPELYLWIVVGCSLLAAALVLRLRRAG